MNVRRRPFLDEYVEDGESAALLDDQVLVLSPFATTTAAVAWLAELGLVELS